MSDELTQIKDCYELHNMSPEDIAFDRQLELCAVKTGLNAVSPKYRADCGVEIEKESDLDFTKDDLREVNMAIKALALGAENEGVRLNAAIYIREDKKGRKDIKQAVGGNQFNILQFNSIMQSVRATGDKLREKVLGNGEAIGV